MHPDFSAILLPTAEIVLENPLNKQEIRVTALFDQSSQRTYVTQKEWKTFHSSRQYAQKEFLFLYIEIST